MIDSSVVLAYLFDEPGGDRFEPYIDGGRMSAVNYSEVIARLARRDADTPLIAPLVASFPLTIIDLGKDVAVIAGQLIAYTRDHGLSLGDRVCLAQAMVDDATVVTADTAWLPLAETLALPIELIR